MVAYLLILYKLHAQQTNKKFPLRHPSANKKPETILYLIYTPTTITPAKAGMTTLFIRNKSKYKA